MLDSVLNTTIGDILQVVLGLYVVFILFGGVSGGLDSGVLASDEYPRIWQFLAWGAIGAFVLTLLSTSVPKQLMIAPVLYAVAATIGMLMYFSNSERR